MGNHHSSFNFTGKLILPNLKILNFHHPVTAAELMFENPHTFIVEFQPNSTCKHLLPLPADHTLNPNKVHLMIPMSRSRANGVPVEEARRILWKARQIKISFVPFVWMCVLGDREEEEEEEAEKVELLVDEEAELMCGRQYSSKGWKPSLGTIQEMSFEKMKVPHWLF